MQSNGSIAYHFNFPRTFHHTTSISHKVFSSLPTMASGPEAQDALFDKPIDDRDVPHHLARAAFRMDFPPSYVFVGVYRLCTDKNLYKPAWDKCRHAARRGAIVGVVWVRVLVLVLYRD